MIKRHAELRLKREMYWNELCEGCEGCEGC